MKNQILNSVIAIGFAALVAQTPAAAQTNHVAIIPFSFQAGGTEYPEGTYEIRRMGSLSVIRITNVETKKSGMISTPVPAGSPKSSAAKLVFSSSGDQHALAEVWLEGQPGMKTYKSAKTGREEASVKVAVK